MAQYGEEGKWDFNKIKRDDMVKYIEALPADTMVDFTDENGETKTLPVKKWFKSVAIENKPKKQAEYKMTENGNFIYKQAKDNAGNPKFNEDGTPKMIKAKQYVKVAGSKAKPAYNHLKAKLAFCHRFMPDIVPVEKEKDKPHNPIFDW